MDDYPNLKRLEERWMVTLGSLASLDPVAGMNKRDDAKAGARNWGTWRGSGVQKYPRFFFKKVKFQTQKVIVDIFVHFGKILLFVDAQL